MGFSLLPKYITESLTDLSVPFLKARGIRLLMLDFDNTIVPYTTDTPTAAVKFWLETLRASGISLCVVSNSRKPRVQDFCREHNLPCIPSSRKPFPRGIRRCLEQFGIAPSEAALVGDQIFTDTLGANCQGVTSILVKPICNHNFWLKARHLLEQPMIYLARKSLMVRCQDRE